MSVLQSDLAFYGSANMPDIDGSTTGGAVTFSVRVDFSDITPNGTLNYVSSSASDTAAIITVSGRDATGVIVTEAKTLTGTTPVAGTQTFERLLKGVVTGTTAVGDIAAISNTAVITVKTARAGSAQSTTSLPATLLAATGDGATIAVGHIIRTTGGTGPNQLRRVVGISGDTVYVNRNWTVLVDNTTTYVVYQGYLFDLLPSQITQIRRPFYNAAADVPGGASRTYYEKIFAVNTNTTTALTGAAILKQVDNSTGNLIGFALTNALNDTSTITNRQTLPTVAITAFSTGAAPLSISVPGSGNLPSGAVPNAAGAEGIWLSLVLAAGTAAQKTSFTMRASGTTT